jgi:hypothetical protein
MKISRPTLPSLTLLVFSTATLALYSAAAAAGAVSDLPLLAQQATAEGAVPLNPRHPDKYVVKRGDTLWDISAMFLRDPWYWPEIWQVNPQVANPHLIYPGDVLTLVYVNGRPQLRLERGMAAGTEKLSPRIREQSLDEAIPTIPRQLIEAFLGKARVIEKDELDELPYVVAIREGHMMGAAGNDLYVRGDIGAVDHEYSVVHVADPLRDPVDGDLVGYRALYVGDGAITRGGDPATLSLKASQREALTGDRLVANDLDGPLEFAPRPPPSPIDGRIMAVFDGVYQIAQYQVVVINRGARDGLEPGHVLTVWQAGKKIRDSYDSGLLPKKVRLPDERTGVSMVFRTYDRISYALIMEATSEIHVLDKVRNPS